MLKEKQICSFGKAFLSKKRFLVKICVILWLISFRMTFKSIINEIKKGSSEFEVRRTFDEMLIF